MVPWQFALRAVMVVTGLTMLLFAHVQGALFYIAWGLIALALVSEAAATFFYWRGSRRRSGS